MSTSEPRRAEALFYEAVALVTAERAAFLDTKCGADPVCRAEVEELLQSHDEAEGFLKEGGPVSLGAQTEFARVKPEAVGDRIGPYKLLEQIGEGGFGTVWVAEQEKPIRRRVALKIIKLGMDTKDVVARFEQERQALAMMDHPNIAKVLDAGATPLGRPFFVMELVRGVKITEYCDEAKAPTGERLRLFIAVCQAVQHAHQKGIIHRDLKPSNILVSLHDGVPVPKVIDFGVAKATQQRLTDLTIYTQFEQMIGTPLYMSPEQAELSGIDVDTRSDIYSLGVLLYELLTGRTPFDPQKLIKEGYDEVRRIIREEEPPKPSTLVSTLAIDARTTLAQHRQTDGAKLIGQIRGDLDWIVMKALEKDRARRYETANGLALDIERHLASEPVFARPPTQFYRLRRFARRNKLAFTATAVVIVALIAGLSISLLAFRREQTQHKLADQARFAADEQRVIARTTAVQASQSEGHARRLLYASDILLAQRAFEENNLGRARRLLDRHRPESGKEDLRGWEWRYLWQQCRGQNYATLTRSRRSATTNSNYSVASLSVSPDGRKLAVSYTHGQVDLWDLLQRKILRVLRGPLIADFEIDAADALITRVAYSPITETVVASNGDGEVILYDLVQEHESTLCKLEGEVRDLCYSPDGACIAVLYSTSVGGVAIVVDATDRKVITKIQLPEMGSSHFGCVRLSPDHRQLYVSFSNSGQPKLRCVRIPEGDKLWESKVAFQSQSPRPVQITAMAVSPDGKCIATAAGFETEQIQVSETETGQLFATLEGHTGYVKDLAFSRDGRTLVSVSSDQTARMWNTATWESMPPMRGHGEQVTALALTADANTLVTGDREGFVMLWDLQRQLSPSNWTTLRKEISFARVLPGTDALLVRDTQQSYSLLDLTTMSERKLPFSSRHSTWFVSPNFIGVQTKENRFELHQVTATGTQPMEALSISPLTSSSIAYCAAKRILAWLEDPRIIRVTNLDQSSEQITINSGEDSRPVGFSADGTFLLAVTDKCIARVWNIKEKRREAAAEEYLSPFELPLMARNRNVSGLDNIPHSCLLKWLRHGLLQPRIDADRADGAEGASAPDGFWPSGPFGNRAFSPDGHTFAVATALGEIALYDSRGLTVVARFEQRQKTIYSIAFSRDGKRLFAPNNGLWDVDSGQEVLVLPARLKNLYHAEWTDDGNTLLAGRPGDWGSFQLWRAPSWKEIEDAERTGDRWMK